MDIYIVISKLTVQLPALRFEDSKDTLSSLTLQHLKKMMADRVLFFPLISNGLVFGSNFFI